MARTQKPLTQAVAGGDAADLTEEERLQVEQEAAAEVHATKKKRARAKLKKELVAKGLKGEDPNEETRTVMLDLAGHSDRLTIDGKVYFHGHTYEVPKSLYDVIQEAVTRGWRHEAEIGGANTNAYRKPRNVVLSPGQGM